MSTNPHTHPSLSLFPIVKLATQDIMKTWRTTHVVAVIGSHTPPIVGRGLGNGGRDGREGRLDARGANGDGGVVGVLCLEERERKWEKCQFHKRPLVYLKIQPTL